MSTLKMMTPQEDLEQLTQERDAILAEVMKITRDGKEPPDGRTTALEMKYAKVMDDIAQVRAAISAGPDKKGRNADIVYRMFKAAYGGVLQDTERRTITLTNGTATLLDPSAILDYFALLRADNPLGRMPSPARFLNMLGNNTQFPIEATGAEVQWISHGGSVTEDTALTLGSRKLDFSHAAILLKVHNHWIEDTDTSAGVGIGPAMLQDLLIRAMNEAIIKVVLTGTGSGQPTGLDNLTGAGGVQTVDAGSVVLANFNKFIDAVQALLSVNVPLDRIGGIISPEIWGQFNKLMDSQNRYLDMPSGLRNVPMYVSSAALDTYQTNTETRAYLGDWGSCIIGMNGGPVVRMLTERYAEDFVTGFLVSMRCDVQFVRRNSFCIVTDVANA